MSEWQSMESAPKDGTVILAYFPELGQHVAWFDERDSVNNAGGWAIGQDYYGAMPTHWKPLGPDPST